jgi:hypothetical protein
MTTSPINVALTVAERDAIDGAKGRIRRLASLVSDVLDYRSESDHDDETAAILDAAMIDVLKVILDDVCTIDATFAAAAQRRPASPDVDGAR